MGRPFTHTYKLILHGCGHYRRESISKHDLEECAAEAIRHRCLSCFDNLREYLSEEDVEQSRERKRLMDKHGFDSSSKELGAMMRKWKAAWDAKEKAEDAARLAAVLAEPDPAPGTKRKKLTHPSELYECPVTLAEARARARAALAKNAPTKRTRRAA